MIALQALRRAGLGILLTVSLFGGVSAHSAEPEGPSDAARRAWGFDRSDLAPHPGVRFGVLPNGMRYALMRNTAPPGGLAVRLHLDVGALDEQERELGFAHLVEHMIFHGSENIPEGALPLMLSTRGLARWTDFNAFTSHDETVYRLDLARADAAARETALTVMREIAGRLRFQNRNVAGAMRKVQEEIRARDAMQDRMDTALNQLLLPGTRLARGPVAGTVAEVGRARAAGLQAFYERSYRPERATLVLVGDVDLVQVEAEIARHFADWPRPPAPAPGRASASRQRQAGTQVRLVIDRGAPTSLVITSAEPTGGADAAPRRDGHFLERLGTEMLGRRLARIAAAPDAPFGKASAALYDHFSTARLARIDLDAPHWRRALEAAAGELRRALAEGFSQAELDEQIAATGRGLARNSRPRTSTALADAIVDAVGRGLIFTQPGDPAASAAYVRRVRLADVNAAFRSAWGKPNRLILLAHDRAIAGGEPAVREAWDRAFNAPRPTPAEAARPGA
jgi:zinc protease